MRASSPSCCWKSYRSRWHRLKRDFFQCSWSRYPIGVHTSRKESDSFVIFILRRVENRKAFCFFNTYRRQEQSRAGSRVKFNNVFGRLPFVILRLKVIQKDDSFWIDTFWWWIMVPSWCLDWSTKKISSRPYHNGKTEPKNTWKKSNGQQILYY